MTSEGSRDIRDIVDSDVRPVQFIRSPAIGGTNSKVASSIGCLHVVGPVADHGAALWMEFIPDIAEHHRLRLVGVSRDADYREQLANACLGQNSLGIPGRGVAADA
jgi:glutamine amidotransferase PdxT